MEKHRWNTHLATFAVALAALVICGGVASAATKSDQALHKGRSIQVDRVLGADWPPPPGRGLQRDGADWPPPPRH
jgi:hypothetical protein